MNDEKPEYLTLTSTTTQIRTKSTISIIKYISHVDGREVDPASTIKYIYQVKWLDTDVYTLKHEVSKPHIWPRDLNLQMHEASETILTIVEKGAE